MNLVKTLQGIGIRDVEARVYLACLELGDAPASAIAKKARLKRPSVYVLLKDLMRKGHIASSTRRGITRFIARDPEAIIAAAREHAHAAEAALPELLALAKTGGPVKPVIRYYEGEEGIRTILADTIATANATIRMWSDAELATKTLGPAYAEYHQRRAAQHVTARAILEDNATARRLKARAITDRQEVRLVPEKEYNFNDDIIIYSDKVAMISYRKLIGVIIENEDIAETQTTIFRLAWERAGAMESK